MKLESFAGNLQAGPHATRPTAPRRGELVLIILVAIMAGVSALLHPTAYSVLLVLGIGAAMAFLVACFRNPLLALYAALILTLLPDGLLPETAQSILNRTLTLTAAMTWAFGVIRHKPRFIWPVASTYLLSFLLWASVTLFWAGDPETGATKIVAYAMRFVLFLIVLPNLVRTQRELDGMMKALAYCGWALVSTAIARVLLVGYVPGTRLALFGVNANDLGLALTVLSTGVLWQALKPTQAHRIPRILSAVLFVPATVTLIGMTGSRGSVISLLVALAALLLWKPTRRWGTLGLSLVVLVVLFFPSIYSATLARFSGTSGDTTLLGGREVLWQQGWELITEHPLVGIGVGNSPFEMKRELTGGGDGIPIHNPVLVIWSETGIVGLALYLGVLTSAALSFCRCWRNHQATGVTWLRPYFYLVASVMLGYLASWIKGGGAETAHAYFLMLSLLLVPSGLDKGVERGADVDSEQAPPLSTPS